MGRARRPSHSILPRSRAEQSLRASLDPARTYLQGGGYDSRQCRADTQLAMIGVSMRVTPKGKKLYYGQLAGLRQRFKTIKRTFEAQYLRKMLDRLLRGDATPEQILQMKEELARRLAQVDAAVQTVETANEPSVMESFAFKELETIARLTYEDDDGSERTYLAPEELAALSLPKGTLTSEERAEDRVPRQAYLCVSLHHSLDARPACDPTSGTKPSREARRERLSLQLQGGRYSSPDADDDDLRYLRRAHRERPPL